MARIAQAGVGGVAVAMRRAFFNVRHQGAKPGTRPVEQPTRFELGSISKPRRRWG